MSPDAGGLLTAIGSDPGLEGPGTGVGARAQVEVPSRPPVPPCRVPARLSIRCPEQTPPKAEAGLSMTRSVW